MSTSTSTSISTTSKNANVVVIPVPVKLEPGETKTIVVQKESARFSLVGDLFENHSWEADNLLTLNFPSCDNTEWSFNIKPPRVDGLACSALLKKNVNFPEPYKSLSYNYAWKNFSFQVSGGNIHSFSFKASDLGIPRLFVESELYSKPSVWDPSILTIVKSSPFGLSLQTDYNLKSGVCSGNLGIFHALKFGNGGNRFGMGLKGEFVDTTPKDWQFATNYTQGSLAVSGLLKMTSLRNRPTSFELSLHQRDSPFLKSLIRSLSPSSSSSSYELGSKIVHDLENGTTKASLVVRDTALDAKIRINSSGCLGFSKSFLWGPSFSSSSSSSSTNDFVRFTLGFDFDFLSRNLPFMSTGFKVEFF